MLVAASQHAARPPATPILVKPDTSTAAPTRARPHLPTEAPPRLLGSGLLGRLSRNGHPDGRHWADVAVVPVVLLIFAGSLLLFARTYRLFIDDGLYLLEGSNLMAGKGLSLLDTEPQTVRGPVFPVLVGLLTLVFDRDVGSIGFVVRILAVVNPFLVYLLVRRLADPVSALLAAILVAAFGYVATLNQTLNVDAAMLSLWLGAVLLLVRAVDTGRARPALVSGLLLGAAILTKETALATLPAAALATLLLGLPRRQAAFHYAAVAGVCLPWVLYVLATTGEVYLVGRVSPFAAAFGVAIAGLAAGALAWLSRREQLRRRLAAAGSRQLVAAVVVAAWVLALGAMLLSTTDQQLNSTLAQEYLKIRVLPVTTLWQVLPLAGLWLAVRAVRGNRLWAFYLALVVMQAPVALLLLAERYPLARHWLLIQTLMYGALAAMLVALFREFRARREWTPGREILAAGAIGLGVVLLGLGLVRGKVLFTAKGSAARLEDPRNQVNAAVRDMSAWMEHGIPKDELVTTTFWYAYQVVFFDEGDHRWRSLQFECPLRPRSLVEDACGVSPEIARKPPTTTAWLNMDTSCGGAALSLSGLTGQMDRSGSRYLLLTEDPQYPGLFPIISQLERSGAFRVVHSSYLPTAGPTPESHGLVMLERTGRPAAPVPATMTPSVARLAIDCRVEELGPRGYAADLRTDLPNGIRLVGDPSDRRISGVESAEEVLLRERIAGLYRTSASLDYFQ